MATTATTTNRIILGKNLTASKKFPESLIEGAICLDVLEEDKVKELIYTYEGKRYLNLQVINRKEVSKFGRTHYIEVDTFVPEQKEK